MTKRLLMALSLAASVQVVAKTSTGEHLKGEAWISWCLDYEDGRAPLTRDQCEELNEEHEAKEREYRRVLFKDCFEGNVADRSACEDVK